jgi:hypothetical protein
MDMVGEPARMGPRSGERHSRLQMAGANNRRNPWIGLPRPALRQKMALPSGEPRGGWSDWQFHLYSGARAVAGARWADSMSVDLSSARLTDLTTYADREIVSTPSGLLIWMTVDLNYHVPGLSPSVSIRVPVDYVEGENNETRRQRAMRAARRLIDRACTATGVAPETPPRPRPARSVAKRLPVGPEAGRGGRPETFPGMGHA